MFNVKSSELMDTILSHEITVHTLGIQLCQQKQRYNSLQRRLTEARADLVNESTQNHIAELEAGLRTCRAQLARLRTEIRQANEQRTDAVEALAKHVAQQFTDSGRAFVDEVVGATGSYVDGLRRSSTSLLERFGYLFDGEAFGDDRATSEPRTNPRRDTREEPSADKKPAGASSPEALIDDFFAAMDKFFDRLSPKAKPGAS